jgi:glycosyltransferase involved in cell wall biosynthesis
MRITLSLLTWNRADCLDACLHALAREARTLRLLGHQANILVIDNGSTDQTQEVLCALRSDHHFFRMRNAENIGAARARNQAFDFAILYDADFHFLLDGDIEVVPESISAQLRYLERNPDISAIAPYYECQTPDPGLASPVCKDITEVFTELCAPTQYGLLRKDVYERFRFDEFYGAGYGLEDWDFGLTLFSNGLQWRYFNAMRYLHHGYHSSVLNLMQTGMDVQQVFDARRAYFIRKWETMAGKEPTISTVLHSLRYWHSIPSV